MLSTTLDWEHVGRVREMVRALPAEDQRRGARLNRRCRALDAAIEAVRETRTIASEHYREHVLETLEDLKREAGAAFRAFREERGIPDVTDGRQA